MRRFLTGLALIALAAAGLFASPATGLLVPRTAFAAHRARIAEHMTRLDPEGPSRGAVLLFHGCGGVRSAVKDWAAFFVREGYTALIVDSLAARGFGRWGGFVFVCTGLALWGQERAGDVLAALANLNTDPELRSLPVALASWSHGGWAVMEALGLDPSHGRPWGLDDVPSRLMEEADAVLLVYPYCGFASSPRAGAWQSRPPALALLAGKDSVVGAEPCLARFADMPGAPLEIHVYPEADHSFDESIPNPLRGLEYDPVTTGDARARASAFLARSLTSSR